MKKLTMLLAAVAAMAMTNYALADVGPKGAVQLWADGPYWATTNIGAEEPEDYGYYFWWGDTTGYRPSADGRFGFMFRWDNPAIYTYDKTVSELQSAGWVTSSGVLAPSHDAAHVKWGDNWRMPTRQELIDLYTNQKCSWTWTTRNGVYGYIVRGGGAYASKSIFLPAAGYGDGTFLYVAGLYGEYWSSVPCSNSGKDVYELHISSDYHIMEYYTPCYGFPIRPVRMTPWTPSTTPSTLKPDSGTPTLFTAISGTRVVGGGSPDMEVASVWDGWIKDGTGVSGTVQVKVGKATVKKPAKLTASVVLKDSAKRLSFKGEMAAGATEATLTCGGQSDLVLSFGESAMAGAWGARSVIGGRNLFASKDKASAANGTLAPWKGAVNAKWDGGTLSITLGNKGKAKIAVMLANGTKATANGQFVIGEGWCAVPVVVNKKANLGFIAWLNDKTGKVEVYGLGDGTVAGKVGMPPANLTFAISSGFDAIDGLQAALLPARGYEFSAGAKWTFSKADAVKLVDGVAAIVKDNGNPSGLKLTYKAKDGSFKGKFTVYTVAGGKLKKLTANVTGVMIGAKGYGTAAIKSPAATASVTIE